MPRPSHCRVLRSTARVLALCALLPMAPLLAQDASGAPASIPAGIGMPRPDTAPIRSAVSAKAAREAEDAFVDGAKHVEHNELRAAERSFTQALKLNPGNHDYALALAVTREHLLTELVQQSAKARLAGDATRADSLLAEARVLDPDNLVVTQHLGPGAVPLPMAADPALFPANHDVAATLDGPIRFAPLSGKQNFHRVGAPQDILRAVYTAYNIIPNFDSSVTSGPVVQFDLTDVDFTEARRIVSQMTHTFAVPLQSRSALILKDTQDNRDQFLPQIEETLNFPGITQDVLLELANVARTVFEVKQVSTSPSSGAMLLRGDEPTLKLVTATLADMLDGGSDVLLDIHLYEIDKTRTRNIGAQLPTSAGVFSIAAEAQTLVSANQSVLNQAIAAGLIKLSGNSITDLITEVGFLIASGTVSATQYTNLLGIFGKGLSLAGLYLGSSSSFNLLLNSSDVRTLDAIQVRGSNHQALNFRAGTRYPVVTATYSSGISSSLASSLAGATIGGKSVSSLLSQYLGAGSSASIPQFQFEDLGLTLKTTPQITHGNEVTLQLDMKIESLGGGTINSIPILNSRALTSTVTVPLGQTALLVSELSSQESKSIQGLPGLSELPGFQGTDQNTEKDSGELLITITPHIVRTSNVHIASRRIASGTHSSAPQ